MLDPVVMNHPDLPGVENAVVERDAYRGTWYALGWRSTDDPGFVGPSFVPVPRTVGGHESRFHKEHVVVPGAWGKNRWFAARKEGAIRQVKVHRWGDSIGAGVGATNPYTDGCHVKHGDALRAEYGDGGTGWLPAGLTAPQFQITTTGAPTGGSFVLNISVNGGASQPVTIAFNASAATVQTAIDALSNIPDGTTKTNGGALPTAIGVVFTGSLATSVITVTKGTNSLTGGSSPDFNCLTGWPAGMGMGGSQLQATAPAALHFSNMRGTQIRLFHRNANITGSFRWRVDGGSWTTVTPPTDFGQDPGAVVVGSLSDTAHTFDVEWISGTVSIFGIEATRATGIVMYNFSQSGRAGVDFGKGREQYIRAISGTSGTATITSPGAGSFNDSMVGKFIDVGLTSGIPAGTTITAVASATSATISTNLTATLTNAAATVSEKGSSGILGAGMVADPFLAPSLGRPDLVIIQLGANDPSNNSNDPQIFRQAISNIIRMYTSGNSVNYTPDFIFVIEHMGNWFDIESKFAAFAAVIASLAVSHGGVLIDMWGLGRRSWKYWSDLGYFADAIHPSTAGAVQYAQPQIDVCLMTES